MSFNLMDAALSDSQDEMCGTDMFRDMVKQTALANGFKLKEQPDGTMELNPYVYEFAQALLAEKAEDDYQWHHLLNQIHVPVAEATTEVTTTPITTGMAIVNLCDSLNSTNVTRATVMSVVETIDEKGILSVEVKRYDRNDDGLYKETRTAAINTNGEIENQKRLWDILSAQIPNTFITGEVNTLSFSNELHRDVIIVDRSK